MWRRPRAALLPSAACRQRLRRHVQRHALAHGGDEPLDIWVRRCFGRFFAVQHLLAVHEFSASTGAATPLLAAEFLKPREVARWAAASGLPVVQCQILVFALHWLGRHGPCWQRRLALAGKSERPRRRRCSSTRDIMLEPAPINIMASFGGSAEERNVRNYVAERAGPLADIHGQGKRGQGRVPRLTSRGGAAL